MRMISTVGLGLAILAGNGVARAQQLNIRETFQNLDANNDMVIDRDEVPEEGRAAFDRLLAKGDANKNGKLEADEFRTLALKLRALAQGGLGLAGQRFQAMDTDGDGKVSKAEFKGPELLFKRLDADKDGFITTAEALNAFKPQEKPAAPEPAASEPKPRAEPKPANDSPKAKRAALLERLKAMDKDGDGTISKDEFKGREALFDRLDTDKDGTLSKDEIRKPQNAAGKKAKKKDKP
ncbi:MAG: EF-hand domain-containing protein [Isosphaeraceae bacterium]